MVKTFVRQYSVEQRNKIHAIVTNPPCCYRDEYGNRLSCGWWDKEGHYCAMEDKTLIPQCTLVIKILDALNMLGFIEKEVNNV